MWFKKPDPSKALQQLAELMTIVEKRVATLEIEVDSIRIRLRKKTFFGKETEEPEKKGIDDGFDELRKLNKEHDP